MESKTFLTPVQKFINAESFSGILLFFSTLIALLISNLPLYNFYESIWQYKVGIETEHFRLVKPLILWINDGLMAVFFFLIGLEIKREILLGELNTVKKAALPAFAAIGGMVVPMIIYLIFNTNPETADGWGIPMATDIAFTLAILKLLGKRVPLSFKVFLTAFAIIDDIGAVLVIALFYTSEISWMLLLYAGILLSVLYVMSAFRVHNKLLFICFGIIIWILFLKAGIHPTIAGILLAFAVPVRQRISEFTFANKLKEIIDRLTTSTNTNKLPMLSNNQIEEIDNLVDLTSKVQSPLQRLEHSLHNWVAFLIMPVFALSNAGIHFSNDVEVDFSLAIIIAVSLFAGKTIGVSLFSYLGIKLKMATLPENLNINKIIGIAVLSGVGFTMSLFIGGLAFGESVVYLNSAKVGIIAGSLFSGIAGYIIIKNSVRKNNGS